MIKNEPELVEMPLFYFSRLRESDRSAIEVRMRAIPENKRSEVAKEYTRLYLSGETKTGRKLANKYLQGIATEYKNRRYHENRG